MTVINVKLRMLLLRSMHLNHDATRAPQLFRFCTNIFLVNHVVAQDG